MYKLPWPRLRWLFVLILIAGVRLSAAPPLPVDPPEAGTEIDFPLPGKYDAREVCPGVLFHSYVYEDFFGKPQVVSILEISLARRDLFMALRRCTDSRMTPEQFAREYRATAVLNCGFFNFKDNSPSFGFMLAGKVIGQFRPSPGSGVLAFPNQRTPVIFAFPDESAFDPRRFREAISFPNLLVSGGEKLEFEAPAGYRHPRTAVGITADKRMIWLIVDGRSEQSQGVNLNELAALMKECGCVDALNLDGGGSSAMWVKFPREKGSVVNHPSDNRKFDHEGARAVHDVLVLRRFATVPGQKLPRGERSR